MTNTVEKPKAISNSIRVLVVDNDKETRRSICDILEQGGYIVRAADGMGEQLVKDAIALAKRLRPHVAIIDLRIDGSGILDHLRPNDQGGFRLIPYLQGTHCILCSGYLTTAIHREARHVYGVYTAIETQESPDIFLKIVREAGIEKSAKARQVDITWERIPTDYFKYFFPDETTKVLRKLRKMY